MNKKTVCLLLALVFVLLAGALLGACNRGNEPQSTTPGTEATTEPAEHNNGDPTDGDTNPATPTEATEGVQVEAGVTSREEFEDTTPPAETTKPEEEESAEPIKPTEPITPTEPLPPADTSDPANVTYAQYLAMSDEEEEAFVESFPTLRDFINWRNAALEKEQDRDAEILDGNEIDLGKLNP